MPELGLSFGNVAALYDRVRPPYLRESLDRAQEALELDGSAKVLDLAAGTGTLTRALAERFEEVVAVEPDDEMRAVLARRSTQVEALAGSAERIPLPDRSADAVFVGDAFHWFDASTAVAEIVRVLRPLGGVALLWNHWWSDGADGTSDSLEPPLPDAARALLDAVYVRSGRAAAVAENADPLHAFAAAPFEPFVEVTFTGSMELSGPEVADLYSTVSAVASLPPAERNALKRQFARLLEQSYRLEISTVLLWTRLAR